MVLSGDLSIDGSSCERLNIYLLAYVRLFSDYCQAKAWEISTLRGCWRNVNYNLSIC